MDQYNKLVNLLCQIKVILYKSESIKPNIITGNICLKNIAPAEKKIAYLLEISTAFLEEYLIETFDLPDKRGQSAYASWDKAYAEWQEKAGQAKKVIAEKIETGNYDGEVGE